MVAKSAMPLYVRIPAWATTGTTVNGVAAANGTMFKFSCAAGSNTVTVKFAAEITVKRWGDEPMDGTTGPVSVHRGPLVFSLPISGNYTVSIFSSHSCPHVRPCHAKSSRRSTHAAHIAMLRECQLMPHSLMTHAAHPPIPRPITLHHAHVHIHAAHSPTLLPTTHTTPTHPPTRTPPTTGACAPLWRC